MPLDALRAEISRRRAAGARRIAEDRDVSARAHLPFRLGPRGQPCPARRARVPARPAQPRAGAGIGRRRDLDHAGRRLDPRAGGTAKAIQLVKGRPEGNRGRPRRRGSSSTALCSANWPVVQRRADLAVQLGGGRPAGVARVEVALHEPGRVLTVPVEAVSGRDVPDQIVHGPEPGVGAANLSAEQRMSTVGRRRGDLQSSAGEHRGDELPGIGIGISLRSFRPRTGSSRWPTSSSKRRRTSSLRGSRIPLPRGRRIGMRRRSRTVP